MKVAVVGAQGFIGSALVRHLSHLGHDVDALARKARQATRPHVTSHVVDVLSPKFTYPSKPEVVFYFAQSPGFRVFPRQGAELFGVNTQGAIQACHAANRAGARLFVYASTGNVYQPSFTPFREDSPVRRDEPYPASKVLAEEALALYRKYLAVCALRIFGVFGPGQKTMLPVVLREKVETGAAVMLEPSPVDPTDQDGLRVSFLCIDDAVRCLTALAERASVPPVLNLAGPRPISIREFASALGKAIGREPVFARADLPRASDLIADVSLLRATLNPEFTPFERAISDWVGGRK